MQREQRLFVAGELRAAGSDQKPKISGYAAVFENVTTIGGQFNEVIQRGAFKNTLAADDEVVALIDHNPSLLLGRRSAGTLTLEEDSKGLKFVLDLPETSVARDAYANLKAGNLKECSFGFYVNEGGESWSQLPDGTMLRTLTDLTLFDISVVTFPAYSGTSASARNIVPADVESRMAAANKNADRLARLARGQAFVDETAAHDAAEDINRLKLRYENLLN